jgi:Glycine zipper
MPRNIAMRPTLAILLLAGLGLAGCGDMNQTQQRTATGALGGAAVGGILGSFSGNAGLGALLGAGVGGGGGGGGGYLYDQSQQSQQRSYGNQTRSRNSYRG